MFYDAQELKAEKRARRKGRSCMLVLVVDPLLMFLSATAFAVVVLPFVHHTSLRRKLSLLLLACLGFVRILNRVARMVFDAVRWFFFPLGARLF